MHILRDIRHGSRAIRRTPVFAAVVILSLGVGIGVNTAIFSWIQAVVLQPLPGVRHAGSLMLIEPRTDTGGYPGSSWLEYRDLQRLLPTVTDLFAFRGTTFNAGEPDKLERTFGVFVSPNYFQALALTPALGRFPGGHESGDGLVIISHDFWQTRFGGAPAALGQTIRLNGKRLTIIGVTPAGFQGTAIGLSFDLWVPAQFAPQLIAGSRELELRDVRGYRLAGRLAPGVTRDAAQADLNRVMRDLAHDFPETNATVAGEVLPFWQAPNGPQRFMVAALVTLQTVMLLVLLAVCGNTANLVLARASARRYEIGVRLALGATRWRVANLLVIESVMLALAGAGVGVVIAIWGTNALRAVPLPGGFPIRFQTRIDGIDLAFAATLAIACGLLFGIPAALQMTRSEPQRSFTAGAQAASRSRMRETLMAVQVALALVVLVVAAAFFQSFNSTRETDPGFRRDGVLLAAYDLSGRGLSGGDARRIARRLLDGIRGIPGVERAAIASSVPLDIHGLPLRRIAVEGHPPIDGHPDEALLNIVTPDYFKTMGIAIVEGSDFVDLDEPQALPQAIVNEAFVGRYGSHILGRRIESSGRTYTIAGVVRNSLYESFSEPATPIVYYSYRDRPGLAGEIHLRAEREVASDLRRVVRDLEPELPLYNVRTMNEHIEANLIFRRIPARMFIVLGPLLLVLAAVGIYAVVSYAVSLRTAEIGLRLALGAPPARLITEISAQSLTAIALGALGGWLLAFVIALDVMPADTAGPLILSAVPAALLVVAGVACWVPARHATRIDPAIALRQR